MLRIDPTTSVTGRAAPAGPGQHGAFYVETT